MQLSVKNTDRILVVAPHPDDETIGCGGLLAMFGSQCDVLLLTDGRKGYLSSEKVDEDELVKIRENELREAAKIAGVNRVETLRIPDGTAGVNREKIMSFNIAQYDMIFVPNRQERHKDHCVVEEIFENMRKRQKPIAQLYEYEVWSPLTNPTHSLDISSVIDIKTKMIEQYQSQIKYVDYVSMAVSLSKYRGAGFGAEYTEVFSYIPRKNIIKSIYRILPKWLKKAVMKIFRH